MNISIVLNKNHYTTRVLERDRLTLSLRLDCIVDKDSYLFSAALPSTLPDFTILKNKLDNIKKSSKELNIDMLEKLVSEVDEVKKNNKNQKSFPKLDKYFIPGSSLKGAIRSRIEYKLIDKNNSNLTYSCYIVDGYYKSFSLAHTRFWAIDGRQSREMCNIRNIPNVCIVCDMFGNRELSSLTEFSNAITYDDNPIENIDTLGGIEAIKPNTRFELNIICKNYDYLRLGILFLGLELYSKSPILLGMYKYKYNKKSGGQLFKNKYWFGKVRFELVNVKGIYKEYDIDNILKESREALESEIGSNINWNRGVINE